MTVMVAPPAAGHAPTIVRPAAGPNPGGLASPNNAPKPGATPPPVKAPKIGGSKSPAARVAASRAAGISNSGLISASPARISQLASASAAKIYNPILKNYTQQLAQANGLAQKRTADVTAFGQWYGQQQQALSAQETARQTELGNLLGQLNTGAQAGTTNGLTSSDGTNFNAPTGGAEALAASGDNAARSGLLSTDALASASNTALSQNELGALGGSYEQNMMAAISSDLTKGTTTIEDAQSKALSAEGTAQAKIDSNLVSYINGQNKNIITSNYDQQQAAAKQAAQIIAGAKATGILTPSMAAEYERLTGSLPAVGATATTQIAQQKDAIEAAKVAVSRLKVADDYALGQSKNSIASVKNNITAAFDAAKSAADKTKNATDRVRAEAELAKSIADARAKGFNITFVNGKAVVTTVPGAGAAGRTPLTQDEANTQLAKIPSFGYRIDGLMAPTKKNGVVTPAVAKNSKEVRAYLNNLGAKASPLLWAAFDMKFNDGKLTHNTYTSLLNMGFTPAQLSNYHVGGTLKVR